jgi:antitoxin component of MazEF toxin-antitoxin module
LEVTSAKIDKKTKEKMKRFAHINWSEVIRKAITMKIQEEESRIRARPLDRKELAEAAKLTDSVRAKSVTDEHWDSVKEIRKWREGRK